jgi:hypothetical protein
MYDISTSGNTADHSNPRGWKQQAKFGIKVTQADEAGLNQLTGSRVGYETPEIPNQGGLFSGRSPENRSFLLVIPPRRPNVLVLTVPGSQTASEDTLKSITGISVANIEGNTLTATLTVSHGTFTLAATTGLTFSTGDGTADATMTFSGTMVNVNTAIATISYTSTTNYNGSEELVVSVTDGTTLADDSIAITVGAVNDAPVLTVPGSQSLDEDTSKDITGISVSDVDSASLINIILTVSHGVVSLAQTTGLTFVFGDGTSDVTVGFGGTLVNVNAALATIHYVPDPNFNGTDTLEVAVGDNIELVEDTVTLNVAPVADGPELTVPSGTLVVNEDTTENPVTGISVTAGDGSSITITLTCTPGFIRLSGGTGLLTTNQHSHTFSGLSTNLNPLLSTLKFRPSSNFAGSDSIEIAVVQGVNSTNGVIPITVTGVNDAPIFLVLPTEETLIQKNSINNNIIPDFTVTDIDNGTLNFHLEVSHGGLSFLSSTGITFTLGGSGSNPIIEGSGSIADLNAAFSSLMYHTETDYTGADTIQIEIDDGSGGSVSSSLSLYVEEISTETITLGLLNTRLYGNHTQSFSLDISGDIGGSIGPIAMTSGGLRRTGQQIAADVGQALVNLGYIHLQATGTGSAADNSQVITLQSPNIVGQTLNNFSYPPTAAFQQPGAQITLTEAVTQQGVGDVTGQQGVVGIQGNSVNFAEVVTDIYGNSVEMNDSGNWVQSTAGSGWQISGTPGVVTSFISDARMTVTAQFANAGNANAQIYLFSTGSPDVSGQPEVHTIVPSIAGVGPAPPASGTWQANSGGMSCAFDLDGSLVAGNIGSGFGGSACTGTGNLTSGLVTITATSNGDISDTALSPQAGTAGSGGLMAAEVSVTV